MQVTWWMPSSFIVPPILDSATIGERPRSLRCERRDEGVGDDLQRPPRDLRRATQSRERVGLLPQRRQLLVPGTGGVDRGQQVALAKRLHEVPEHTGLDGARDELL